VLVLLNKTGAVFILLHKTASMLSLPKRLLLLYVQSAGKDCYGAQTARNVCCCVLPDMAAGVSNMLEDTSAVFSQLYMAADVFSLSDLAAAVLSLLNKSAAVFNMPDNCCCCVYSDGQNCCHV
jgi:hypothetical protein